VVAGAKFIGGTGLGSGRNRWMGAWLRRVAQFQARGTVEAVNRPGTAAPCAVARHFRAKIGGAAGPATSTVAIPVVATSASCRATMHGVAQAFGHARAIGAAKSVSLKKNDRVRFKISFQKMLKLKKFDFGRHTIVMDELSKAWRLKNDARWMYDRMVQTTANWAAAALVQTKVSLHR